MLRTGGRRCNVTGQSTVDAFDKPRYAIAEAALSHVVFEAQDQRVEQVGFAGARATQATASVDWM